MFVRAKMYGWNWFKFCGMNTTCKDGLVKFWSHCDLAIVVIEYYDISKMHAGWVWFQF